MPTTPYCRLSWPVALELFAGCGGLALGAHAAGLRHGLLLEHNPDAVLTLRANAQLLELPIDSSTIHEKDIRSECWEDLAHTPCILTGGPPCQPFSMGGKSAGSLDRRDMWPEAIRGVQTLNPVAFLFENVKGLLRPAFSGYVDWILQSLSHARAKSSPGYKVALWLANAADHGVPQLRHRVFIAGIRADCGAPAPCPMATHSEDQLVWDKWVSGEYWERHALPSTCRPSLSGREQKVLARLEKHGLTPGGQPWKTCRDALADLGEPQPDRHPLQHVLRPGARVYAGHTGSTQDWPAKALKAGAHGVPGGENILIDDTGQPRYFTLREAARLQGFPDSYRFPGSWSQSMRQLGNAVPVPLATVAVQWLLRGLNTPTAPL